MAQLRLRRSRAVSKVPGASALVTPMHRGGTRPPVIALGLDGARYGRSAREGERIPGTLLEPATQTNTLCRFLCGSSRALT